MPEFNIERISGMPAEHFGIYYYETRRPVVISGVASQWPLSSWSVADLRRFLAENPGRSKQEFLWQDVDLDLMQGRCLEVPDVFQHVVLNYSPTLRQRFTRVWDSSKGHHTPWHYDGNFVEVFNAQLTGRKRFTLVDPETPIECKPFSILGTNPSMRPEDLLEDRHNYTQFVLEPGDMLYMPRHWAHFVESLEDEQINVNFVLTDFKSGPLTKVAKREREVLVLTRYMFRAVDLLRKCGIPLKVEKIAEKTREYVEHFGGLPGHEAAKMLAKETSLYDLARRLVTELRGS